MWNTTLTWQRVCSAIGLVGFLIWYSGGTVTASARYDWCYNDCGPTASCDTECEADGGGTITCGVYDGGAPEWCDADDCDEVCNPNSNPGVECVWESEPTTCYDYGVYGYCGDDVCQAVTLGEDCSNCSGDCPICVPPPPPCGNSVCEPGETYLTCDYDCDDPGGGGFCGDGICSAEDSEDENSCFRDCAMPNELCEDDFDCQAGFICSMKSGSGYGQCLSIALLPNFGECDTTPDCEFQFGVGFICTQVVDPLTLEDKKLCVWWYNNNSR